MKNPSYRRDKELIVLMRSTKHTRGHIRASVSLSTDHRIQNPPRQLEGQKSHPRPHHTIPTVGTHSPVCLQRQSPRSTIPSLLAGDRHDFQGANTDIPDLLRANGHNIHIGGLFPNVRHGIAAKPPTSRQPLMGVWETDFQS